MSRLHVLSAPAVCALVALSGAPAFAWGPSGHKLAADLAYRELGLAERAKAVAILKAAFADPSGDFLKRFEADLTGGMPAGASPADRDRYIFITAATWPDVIRDVAHPLHGEFHKPLWHFINLPFVPQGDTMAVPPTPTPTPPGMDPKDVVSAIRLCMDDVKAAGTPKRVRAARLCFLLHTIGDVHQPLHAAATFSADKLPHGDEGGNLMLVRQPGVGHSDAVTSIHAIWDELFGRDTRLATIKALGDVIDHDPALTRAALATTLANTDPLDWANESAQDAIAVAYRNGTLNAHRGVGAREFHSQHLDPSLVPAMPSDYESKALPVADRRIALAGYRLADVLAKVLQ